MGSEMCIRDSSATDIGADILATDIGADILAGANILAGADDDVGVSLVGSLHSIGRVRLVAKLPVPLRQRRGVHDHSEDRRIPQRRRLRHGGRQL